MNFKRIVISFFLLLTYSLGFAHNLIPHQHDSETEKHSHAHDNKHEHHHHSEPKKSKVEHEHISHGDHFDEGFYDLLVCFLHDADFHTDDCNTHYIAPTKTHRSLTNKSQKTLFVATLLAVTIEVEQPELATYFNVNSIIFYHSHSIEDSPLRGPPSIS